MPMNSPVLPVIGYGEPVQLPLAHKWLAVDRHSDHHRVWKCGMSYLIEERTTALNVILVYSKSILSSGHC